MRTLDITNLTPDTQPIWLDFLTNLPPGELGPAVNLTPLDWSDFELLRQRCLIREHGEQALDNKRFLKLLVEATRPTAWRGITYQGADLDFKPETLLTVLQQNALLGIRFREALGELSIRQHFQLEAAAKNSAAGCVTPDTAPGKKKKTEPVPPASPLASA